MQKMRIFNNNERPTYKFVEATNNITIIYRYTREFGRSNAHTKQTRIHSYIKICILAGQKKMR